MDRLKQKIREHGIVLSDQVLKLDALLNHQVEPSLIMEMGQEFARRFQGESITKVITVETSGIPVAFATAYHFDIPMVFARRKKTLTTDADSYIERVPSFTKGIVTDIMISKSFLAPEDRLLFIDDIIANGDAARGLLRIIDQAGCELVGMGVVVEKSFQKGAQTIREQGIRMESLVSIAGLEDGVIQFDS
ncbi:xanthine phosphoribosyltransferase [Paenibacillus sp. J2TS4]|uniref:xanthine phosphoribosyltransferase n=1 Tax=Paenibacillus sp. J2TS4 TaxID=2807194 RepID=UPI001B17572D|nr:xanthine phosphoribosyltransferase [Paenibacillus sp. J2TS4]GIP33962.1 xanthine phosphoribosyltransferase [Paenibacillus sp. J2TS4]